MEAPPAHEPAPFQKLRAMITTVPTKTATNFVAKIMKVYGIAFGLSLFLYTMFRQFEWHWYLWFARLVYNIPKASEPPRLPPYLSTYLISRAFFSGALLLTLWELSHSAFNLYVAQVPLKHGKVLTEGSSDPNASLINGLKSKKEVVRVSIQ